MRHLADLDPACAMCGAPRATGGAAVNDRRYCSEGPPPTCFEVAARASLHDVHAHILEAGAPRSVANEAARLIENDLVRAGMLRRSR